MLTSLDKRISMKARCVMIGCQDLGLAELERNSPTPSRLSLMLVLQVYASGKMTYNRTWNMVCADATTAFLQGSAGTRPDRLFMLPPRDPVAGARNCFPRKLYDITGHVYSLASAPLEWARDVVRRMNDLGFE